MITLDQTVFDFIYSLAGQSRILDWFGVFFAEYMPIIFVGLVLYFLIREGTWIKKVERFVILAFTFVLSYGIFGGILHFFILRNRPFIDLGFSPLFTETGNAFPSRHALILFSIAALIFSFNKRIGLWLFFFALVNGFARVFVGVHWPSDIVGGAIIGIISYIIASVVLGRFFKKREESPDSKDDIFEEENKEDIKTQEKESLKTGK